MCFDMAKEGKIIVMSAPSGTGKSTVIGRLMEDETLDLQFSISATSRKPRGGEQNGREYYFLDPDEFDRLIAEDAFVEWEEVYKGTKYGTLVREVERVTHEGHNLIMDIDVAGALNVKKKFGTRVLTIFLGPPSLGELERRLRGRATDDEVSIAKRLAKAEYELGFAPKFDVTVVNDDLEKAVAEVRNLVKTFINA